jgi:hypothetical protein
VIRRLERSIPLLTLFFALCTAASASAQAPTATAAPAPDPAQVERARALFAEGVGHVEARRFAEAEVTFREALTLRDAPTIRYNLASVLFEQGEYPEADAQIDAVLADTSVSADIRAHATDLRRQLRAQAGFARVELVGAPDATVAVDGFPLADHRTEFPLSPGLHLTIASRASLEIARSTVRIQTGQHAVVELDATETEAPAPVAEPTPLVEQWWFWTAVGGGVVLSAVLIGVAASSGGVEEPIPGNFQPGVVRW